MDKQTRTRNKRFFGVLFGHLNQAKDRIKKDLTSGPMKQKKEAEAKVTEKLKLQREQEKKKLKRKYALEMREETAERHKIIQKQSVTRVTLLESVLSDHERALSSFLRTKAGPSVYYMPKVHNDKTTALLKGALEECLEKLKNGLVGEKEEEQEALAAKAKEEIDAVEVPEASDDDAMDDGDDEDSKTEKTLTVTRSETGERTVADAPKKKKKKEQDNDDDDDDSDDGDDEEERSRSRSAERKGKKRKSSVVSALSDSD